MEALTVACVRHGPAYGDEWVLRLKAMAAKFLPPHEFVCVTDRPIEGVTCQILNHPLPGWWAKVQLFDPNRFTGRVLYLDLDVVLLASIALPEATLWDLWALDDFSYSLLNPKPSIDAETAVKLGGSGTINSSIMYWIAGGATMKIRSNFKPEVMKRLHGDQNWITQCLWPERIKLFPKGFACSYKYHIDRGEKAAPIVVFHGKPKAPQLERSHWLRKAWEAAA